MVYRPARSPAGTPAAAAGGEQPQANNCDFDKVERYADDVGYVKFDGFVDSQACLAVASAAMEFLAHVKAIIFDLRDNHGGSGGVGVMLDSYLFDRPTHVEDFWDRKTGETHQVWTLPYVPGERFGPIPAYVLTSDMTFSGGEAFAYELQALKRATVVGEVTGGGAHLVSPERIDERFVIGVPTGRPINPITKTDWEGKGVIPDVKVPASEALAVAKGLASQALKTRSQSGSQ